MSDCSSDTGSKISGNSSDSSDSIGYIARPGDKLTKFDYMALIYFNALMLTMGLIIGCLMGQLITPTTTVTLPTKEPTPTVTRMRRSSVDLIDPTPVCAFEEPCFENWGFRSLSGRCNNLKYPDQGRHTRPLRRLLPSVYDDGISKLKSKGKEGRLLNPRVISETIHRAGDTIKDLSKDHTLTLMQWGQFLAHDLVKTPMVTDNGRKLLCDQCKDVVNASSPCEPIPIPKNDGYFPWKDDKGSRKCIPFTRSAKLEGSSEQFNSLTAYLDASNVYGSDLCHSKKLRTFSNGHLKSESHPWSPKIFKPLMPRTSINQDCKSPSGECFFGGDDRSSEQPGLAAMHLIFVREHNRLADQLRYLNPESTDEMLYLEARKIVGAMHQHITYNEFLPRVLGEKMMEVSGLNKPYKYEQECSAEIYNEFAAAAFRFGHSLIRSHFDLKGGDGKSRGAFLKDNFFNIDMISRPQYIDELARGILTEPMATFDVHMSGQLTNHLFETKGKPFSGMDLAALNIQRGRDHGLQGYLQYLRMCTKMYFPEKYVDALNVENFSDLSKFVGLETAALLSRVYKNVADIDLFTGGLSELHLEGGVVGMTLGCIIAHQFLHLKNCDRYWYESEEEFVKFRPVQLEEIRKSTLSSIMCRNMDAPMNVQKEAFDLESNSNSELTCKDHPQLNVQFWSSEPGKALQRSTEVTSCDVNGIIIQAGKEERVSACQICACPKHNGVAKCHHKMPEKDCFGLLSNVGLYAIKADHHCSALCPEQFRSIQQ